MLLKVVKVTLYPTEEQKIPFAQAFGCLRWWWNYGLKQSIQIHKETGKGLGQSPLNPLLPVFKKAGETKWLGDYSQILQVKKLNLATPYKNLFDGRAKFSRFKSL